MTRLIDPRRREWLRRGIFLGAVGFVVTAFGAIFMDVWRAAGRFSTARWTEVAPVAVFSGTGTFPYPDRKIAIIRTDSRLAALSLECTHLGCLLNTIDEGFFCPCHGSEFGPRGEVYSGPARQPLPWHAIRIDGERVWIHSGEKRREPVWVDLERS
jgi:cytochrome b6-f complex iron-sulfur subunit